MADPTTTNILLAAPTRGSDPGTWDTPVNANSSTIDGYIGGVVTVSLSNAPVTLTAPAGTPTPGAGPFQSQNRILKFTGTLSSNVTITLPLPGEYTVQNLTTGAFVVIFRAVGAGNLVSTPQGSIMKIWCDGTDVWLIKNQIPGALTFLGGVSAVPVWITACTIPPYLLCDGTVYNFSTYPALGNLYVGNFGGNGITTFGVEDLRGRVPLAYDGTGTRITVAGSGLNGQTLGASLDKQTVTLLTGNLPAYTPIGSIVTTTVAGEANALGIQNPPINPQNVAGIGGTSNGGSITKPPSFISTSTFTGTAQGGTSTPVVNVQPSQVAGIWLVST